MQETMLKVSQPNWIFNNALCVRLLFLPEQIGVSRKREPIGLVSCQYLQLSLVCNEL